MVQLANSDELAVRYASYIVELQEFFAVHDVSFGAPRELGFFAARLSGRDTFPGELSSMVRSIIFREGGSIPVADLRTVLALAAGGPNVAESVAQLQHPLHDLSTFVASVVRSLLDQPPPTSQASEPAETRQTVYQPATQGAPAAPAVAEPAHSENPFRPHVASKIGLAPATLVADPQSMTRTASSRPAAGSRRPLWAALAVGLPLILLFAFLHHQSSDTAPAPQPTPASSGPAAPSLSASRPSAPTPLSNSAAALAQPSLANGPGTSVSPTSRTSQPRTAAMTSPPTPSPTSSPTAPPVTALSSPSQASPATLPASATSSTMPAPAAPLPAPRPGPSRAVPNNPSVATATAQQGAFGVSSGIMSSHLVSFSPPRYPAMANFTHAQGQVILQAVVSKTGRVSAVKAITGPRSLRKAAENAVKQWRYRPYIADGHAADIATIITIDVKAPH